MQRDVAECVIEESHRGGLDQLGLWRHDKGKGSTSGAITTRT